MTFPSAGAEIYRNDVGEPIGWNPSPDYQGDAFYCDYHGFRHSTTCSEVDDTTVAGGDEDT